MGRFLEGTLAYLVLLIITMTLILGPCAYHVSCGHHLKWSWWNGRWVWVDQDGRAK